VSAVDAEVPIEALFGVGPQDRPSAPRREEPPFRRWSLTTRQMVDRAALLDALRALPSGVLRAKAILRFADAPLERSVVQMVGRRIDIRADGPWGIADLRSDLVLLGTPDMPDDTTLNALFSACRREPAVPPARR
jgi:G3E family GTPase